MLIFYIEISDKINEYHPRASRTLYVGNLDIKTQEETMTEIFSSYGNILVSSGRPLERVREYYAVL